VGDEGLAENVGAASVRSGTLMSAFAVSQLLRRECEIAVPSCVRQRCVDDFPPHATWYVCVAATRVMRRRAFSDQ
jgi:hypothetical protein